jgi:tRNA A22 N-methylase
VYSAFLSKSSWILNSDATTHICCDRTYFNKILLTNSRVSWGKITGIKASEIDNVSITFKDTGLKAQLQNCLFLSELDVNLISISCMTQKDCRVVLEEHLQ